MRKLKNKKLATFIVAFAMLFVVAGAFAVLVRQVNIEARINAFAPQVAIVWTDALVTEHPPLWTGAGAGATGIGIPSIPRYSARVWPTIDIGGLTPAVASVTRGADNHASAWWRLSHDGTGQNTTAGMFPLPGQITGRTLAEPEHYIDLEMNMVFDNFNQTYVWTVQMGNPGDIALTTHAPHVVMPTGAGAWILGGDPTLPAFDATISAIFAPLAGQTIAPGALGAPVTLTFTAPEVNWMAFFATTEGQAFLDNNFAPNSVQTSIIVRVPATMAGQAPPVGWTGA